MSTNHALATPLSTRAQPSSEPAETRRRRLNPIEIITSRSQRKARPKIVYALVATAALFVLLLTQLGISIAVSKGAYQISSLQNSQTVLDRTQQKYTEKLGVLASPQNIANNATALGMVRNQNPVYLDLGTETVYGTPTAAATPATTPSNLIANSLLDGVPVISKSPDGTTTPATTTAPTSSSTTGAAATDSSGSSVASSANQLAAPETR
ncbi:hypothetical protein [Frondihabitans cladoniiphilus]|uniref:Cell division protein FtsL n=1 Tax=Frondihabitans cladoniiphilus TaxID=715785 RepID=A0ABP8W9G1_9MICO